MEPINNKKENWLSRLSLKQLLIGNFLILGSIIATVIIITSVLLKDDFKEQDTPDPNDSSLKLKFCDKVRMFSRKDWSARPPRRVDPLKTPISLVIIAHTDTENCTQISACKDRMRDIQNVNMDINMGWDIEYHFAIGGDGFVYEGRGWTSQPHHTYGYMSKFDIATIAFIGTFNDIQPPDWQIKAALDLLELGVNLNYLTKDYKVVGQRQLHRTLSPGDELYKIITNWTHWGEPPNHLNNFEP